VSPLLVAAAVLLAFAAAWQLAGERAEEIGAALRRSAGRVTAGRVRSLAEAALALGVPERLERAGLARSLAPAAVVAAKAAGAAIGIGAALAVLPSLPARLDAIAVPMLAAAGFFGPDAWLERAARLRRARLLAALPDALDLLAVGAASGRAPAAVMRELAALGSGPLAEGVAVAVAELDCGASQDAAMAALRERAPGPRSGRWPPRSSARAATAHRSPSSFTSRRAPCAATRAAGSRSRPRGRRRRSSWSWRSSSSPPCCS
jgi:Flp pilus assembly protein TadB